MLDGMGVARLTLEEAAVALNQRAHEAHMRGAFDDPGAEVNVSHDLVNSKLVSLFLAVPNLKGGEGGKLGDAHRVLIYIEHGKRHHPIFEDLRDSSADDNVKIVGADTLSKAVEQH